MKILTVAIDTMEDEQLWKYYLDDFIKCTTYSDSASDPNQFRMSIILAYFDFDNHCLPNDPPMSKLAWMHIRSEVNKLDFAQAINRLVKLEPFTTQSALSVIEKTFTTKKWDDLSTFVIENTYNSLTSILNSWKEGDDNLIHWYKAYKDIVSRIIVIISN